MSPRFFLLALGLLLACGSGTIRPADDPDAIAPAPSPAPSPPVVDPDPAPAPSPSPDAPVDPPDASPDTAAQAGAAVEIRRIGRWVSSGIRGSRRLVIRDPATWAQFWSELGAGIRPEVDFGRDLVVAVASGERASGGHDIEVRSVRRAGGELRIEVLETSPGARCLASAALSQPVDVVVAPATGVTGWSFIDRSVAKDC